MSRTLLAVVLLASCTIGEDRAPDALASAWCSKKRSCDRGDYDAQWDSRAECEADIAAAVETVQDFYDLLGCDYSPRGAAIARSDIRSQSCEDFVRGDLQDAELYECGD